VKERRPYAQFDFDIARAVLEQLVGAFRALPIGRLEPNIFKKIDAGQGVYQLFLEEKLMYIGKADKNLRGRLDRHYRMLAARQNIDIEKLGFKAMLIHKNWTTWTTEAALIRFFGEEAPWNASGLGSNDPGHNREDTAEEATFNSRYPIDPCYVCDWIPSGEHVAWDLLEAFKKDLPYLLRFHKVTRKFKSQADHQAVKELKETRVSVPSENMSAKDLLVTIAKQLPVGWQATQFPGRLILYKERAVYRHGHRIWPEKLWPPRSR
jgi:predicted Rdx family selenoprotein